MCYTRGLNWASSFTGRNPRISQDVDGVNGVTPLDALFVINELSNRVLSDPATGELPITAHVPVPIRFLDVKTGTIELLVGNGTRGDGPDGDPLACQLARPHGVFVDKDGTVFIGDSENHRVRVWRK